MRTFTTPELYRAVFEKDSSGAKVLEDLSSLFYDRPSYTKQDPYHTAFLEGQRSVLMHIIRKVAVPIQTTEANDGIQEENDAS